MVACCQVNIKQQDGAQTELSMLVVDKVCTFYGRKLRKSMHFSLKAWSALPETNSSHLKMDGWNTKKSFLNMARFLAAIFQSFIRRVKHCLVFVSGLAWSTSFGSTRANGDLRGRRVVIKRYSAGFSVENTQLKMQGTCRWFLFTYGFT